MAAWPIIDIAMENQPAMHHYDRFPDFWHRHATRDATQYQFWVFGYPLLLTTNSPALVAACADWVTRFSETAPRPTELPMQVRLFVRDQTAAVAPAMAWEGFNLEGRSPFTYDAYRETIFISAAQHGSVQADLARQEATGFVSAALARNRALVSKFVFGTLLYNLLTRRAGLVQWHAVAVTREDAVILLIGHDHSGKSTTALGLLHAGYQLLADGLVYTALHDDAVEVLASPTRELRVRRGAFQFFPELAAAAEPLNTWEGEKYRIDLGRVWPQAVTTASRHTTRLLPLFVSVAHHPETQVIPLTPAAALDLAIPALGWWDAPAFLDAVMQAAQALLTRSPSFQLKTGSDMPGLVDAIVGLGY